jgi:hypothetical protein
MRSGHKTVTTAGDALSIDFPTVNLIQAQPNGASDLYILQIDGLEDLPQYFLYVPLAVR